LHSDHSASLRLSLWDAFFFSLMVGIGETYLPAYALSAGMSEWAAGMFATVPLIAGAVMQLLTPWWLVRVGSIKKWVVGSALLQAMSFVPLVYFCMSPTENVFWIFFFASLYWGAGFASGPTWNFWMGQLVPPEKVPVFFSHRHRIIQIGILLGLVGGGLMLHYKVTMGPFVSVFGILFLVASVSRVLSSTMLAMKRQVSRDPGKPQLLEIFSFWRQPAYRSFFSFLFLFYITIFVSSPFVTPFFLEKLEMNYEQYMLSLASLFLAKIAVLPVAAKLLQRWGVKKVFFIGAIGIAPLPALWALKQDLWFVMALQAVSGVFWGLFEVSLSVTFFNQIKPHQKILTLTAYNLFNAMAVILGSLLGGQILKSAEASLASYYFIFAFGSSLRTLVCLFYAWKVRGRPHLLLDNDDQDKSQRSFAGPISKQVKTV
jgi:predicted MFS family arabinose efflux permease